MAIAARFAPATLVTAVWLGWLAASGGYFPTGWYPVAIGAVALLTIQAICSRRLLPASRPARVALLLLAVYVAWCFASMSWAISADGAWQASNQALLYLVFAWILALTPWTAKSMAILVGLWSLGVAVICGVVLISALGAHDLTHYLTDGRWQQPIGYANATSAIAVMAFLPAFVLSAHRDVPPPIRVVYLVVAAFLADYALLPQSRGALVGVVVATVLLIALAPGRLRMIPRLAVVGVVVGLGVSSIYAVYNAADVGHPVAPALHHAAARMLLGVGVALVGGIVIMLVEMRARPSAQTMRRARIVISVSLAAAILAGLSFGVAENARIGHYISRSWHIFSSPVYQPDHPGPRIAFVNSDQRYDMWRDALRAFRAFPVHGIGSGSFQYHYTAHRHVDTYLRQPHDLWLRVLSETGVIGAALFLGMLISVFGGLFYARRRLDPARAAVVAVGVAVLAYFLVHATVDWLDVIPAVAAPAFALPLAALVLSRRQPAAASAVPVPLTTLPRTVRRVGLLSAGVVALAAVLSLTFPFLSSRQLDIAVARADRDAPGALAAAREAARLDPLATLPHDIAGTIALRSHRTAMARLEFGRSLSLQDAWYPHLELALLDAQSGRFAAARDQIRRSRALDPLDPFQARAAQLIARRRSIDPVAFDAGVLDSPVALWGKML